MICLVYTVFVPRIDNWERMVVDCMQQVERLKKIDPAPHLKRLDHFCEAHIPTSMDFRMDSAQGRWAAYHRS